MPTAAELLGLDSLDQLYASGGAPVQYPIDLDKLVELCYDGWSNTAMAEELGVPVGVIEKRKKQLGLTWLAQQPWLPSAETLAEWYELNPGIRVAALAVALSVSATTLRRHMRHVGFRPSQWRREIDAQLLEAVPRCQGKIDSSDSRLCADSQQEPRLPQATQPGGACASSVARQEQA